MAELSCSSPASDLLRLRLLDGSEPLVAGEARFPVVISVDSQTLGLSELVRPTSTTSSDGSCVRCSN